MKIQSPQSRYIGDNKWVVTSDFTVHFLLRGQWYTMIVKRGFIWDGASMPYVGRVYTRLDRSGALDKMSLPHDAQYVLKGEMKKDSKIAEVYPYGAQITPENRVELIISRKDSDDIMRDIMMYDHPEELSKHQINTIYRFVRWFGWMPWGKPKKDESSFIHPNP
jgi:hypothetical protein